jgi:hypothetical protein
MSPRDLEDRLRVLEDQQAIRDVLSRYARGVDRCDLDLLKSAYHRDGYDDHGFFKGNAWEFADFLLATRAADLDFSSHAISNVSIELRGDEADVESYHLAFQRRAGQDEIQLFAGRYLDLFQRRDGAWAIFRRTVVYDWSLMTRPTSQSRLPLDQFAHGSVYPGDPVYQQRSF